MPSPSASKTGLSAGLLQLILLSCAACGDDVADGALPLVPPMSDAGSSAGNDAGGTVSYARDVQPIFQRCVICHRAGSVIGSYGFDDPFDPVRGIVGRRNSWFGDGHTSRFEFIVKAGSPDESFLIYKVSANPDPSTFDIANNGDPMPFQVPRVTPAELADIKQWISDGAKDDALFKSKVAPVFGTAAALGSRSGKCLLCHYPGSTTGLNLLAPFDATDGLVGVESQLSSKPRVMPGAPDGSFLVEKLELEQPSGGAAMPLHYARLSQAEVDVLRRWISQGARND